MVAVIFQLFPCVELLSTIPTIVHKSSRKVDGLHVILPITFIPTNDLSTDDALELSGFNPLQMAGKVMLISYFNCLQCSQILHSTNTFAFFDTLANLDTLTILAMFKLLKLLTFLILFTISWDIKIHENLKTFSDLKKVRTTQSFNRSYL